MVNDVPMLYPLWSTVYTAIGEHRGEVYERKDSTTTASVSSAMEPEKEFASYELICSSGVLAVWDNPDEDIYSFEDGEAL